MLGSHPVSAVLGAPVSARSETPVINSYIKALCGAGLSILLCKPGSKEPGDYRTKKQIEDDNARFAEETMTPGAVAPGGVHLSTDDVTRLRSYVRHMRKQNITDAWGDTAPVTLACNVGESGLLVADCDTAAQRQAFCDWAAELSGNAAMSSLLPTILTPGVCRDGVWVHRDGAHFYFSVDGVELPERPGSLTITHNGESFSLFWRNRFVLIPPSERAEGAYTRVGPVLSLAENTWLVNEIAERTARPERGEHTPMDEETTEAILEWSADTSWADLLAPEGWTENDRPDACGCPTWNRPGYSTPKSATAHDTGCSRYDSDDPPIHFWTDNPGEAILAMIEERDRVGTLTKLELYAALCHGGDLGAAMRTIPGVSTRGFATRTSVVTVRGISVGVSLGAFENDDERADLAGLPNSDGSVANPALFVDPASILDPSLTTLRQTETPNQENPAMTPPSPFASMGSAPSAAPAPAQVYSPPPAAQPAAAFANPPQVGGSSAPSYPQVGGAAAQPSAPASTGGAFGGFDPATAPTPQVAGVGGTAPAPQAHPMIAGNPFTGPQNPPPAAPQHPFTGVTPAPSATPAPGPNMGYPQQGVGSAQNLAGPAAIPATSGPQFPNFGVTGGVTPQVTAPVTQGAPTGVPAGVPNQGSAPAAPPVSPSSVDVNQVVTATVAALLPSLITQVTAAVAQNLSRSGYGPAPQWPSNPADPPF